MGGLLVLVLIGLYIWGTKKCLSSVQPAWKKALVLVAAILLPTADAVYGRIKLWQMCEAEGGLRIFRVVEGVAGFDDPKSRPTKEWIMRDGYRFVEGSGDSGKPSRMSLKSNGTLVLEEGIAPISEYVYEMDNGDFRNIYQRTESRISVKSTGEILSRAVNIAYAGGFVERFISGLYAARGNAGDCGPIVYRTELVKKTLKPIK